MSSSAGGVARLPKFPLRPDLELIRLVTLTPPPDRHTPSTLVVEDGRSRFEVLGLTNASPVRLLAFASRGLERAPKVTASNLVVVPDAERVAVDGAIRFTADYLTAISHSEWKVHSLRPSVFLRPTSERARMWLQERAGLKREPSITRLVAASSSLTPLDVPAALFADRADGLALLSDAIASTTPNGRYVDLLRLFERAFGLPPARLAVPVHTCVDKIFCFATEEVDLWFSRRGRFVHADRVDLLQRSIDAEQFLGRMYQAAFDILVNKARWHSNDSARRTGFPLPSGTTSATKPDLFASGSHDLRRQVAVYDEYGSFSLHIDGGLMSVPRSDWWPTDDAEPPFEELESGELRILSADERRSRSQAI